MLQYPPPRFEQQKSEVLQRYRILRGTEVHDANQIAATVSLVLGMPRVLICLNERYRCWYTGTHGVSGEDMHTLMTFCSNANLAENTFAVADARNEAYFAREPAVSGPAGVVFFAGARLSDPDGKRFGTLCLIDDTPRSLNLAQMQVLEHFAALISQDICLRSAGRYAIRDLIDAEEDKCALYDLAVTDPLTKALNRRAFFRFAEREVLRATRHDTALSVILFDIDHFKPVNDTHGHAIGDEVLVKLAQTISSSIRDEDLFGRIGGEEFALVLPESDVDAAVRTANRLRQKVGEMSFESPKGAFGVTVSMGVSCPTAAEVDILTALDRADKSLYRAKSLGRNRVEVLLPPSKLVASILPLPVVN